MTELPIYASIQEITTALRAHGILNWADRIDNAVAAGSTGGEILMAVRWELRQLLKDSIPIDDDLCTKSNEIIRWINEAMPTSPDPG